MNTGTKIGLERTSALYIWIWWSVINACLAICSTRMPSQMRQGQYVSWCLIGTDLLRNGHFPSTQNSPHIPQEYGLRWCQQVIACLSQHSLPFIYGQEIRRPRINVASLTEDRQVIVKLRGPHCIKWDRCLSVWAIHVPATCTNEISNNCLVCHTVAAFITVVLIHAFTATGMTQILRALKVH